MTGTYTIGSCLLWAGLAASMLFPALAWTQPVAIEADKAKSFFVAVAHRGGLLSAFGHDHAIVATQWSASVCFDPGLTASRATITIAASSLLIDTPEARQLASMTGSGPSQKDREEIQRKMLGPENLAAQSYPEIKFASVSVRQTGKDAYVIEGALTMRDRTQTLRAPVKLVRRQEHVFEFSGAFAIKQTDYGIVPASVSGLVKVKDTVDVHFRFEGRPAAGGCQ